jgi:hypothetical protein
VLDLRLGQYLFFADNFQDALVRGSAGASLIPVHHELVVVLACEYRLAGFLNGYELSGFIAPTSVLALAAASQNFTGYLALALGIE